MRIKQDSRRTFSTYVHVFDLFTDHCSRDVGRVEVLSALGTRDLDPILRDFSLQVLLHAGFTAAV